LSAQPANPSTAEPRWPSTIGLVAIGVLLALLPESMRLGPYWLALAIVAVLLAASIFTHLTGRHHLNQVFGILLLSLVTLAMASSVVMMVWRMARHLDPPSVLLRSAAALWITNLLIFASWYWRLDAGGPHRRALKAAHTYGGFLFPQMTLDPKAMEAAGCQNWSPGFVDYLFLAFNTSTALSPTDAPVLSRWAKAMMMVQSIISLTTIALLAARAVNIL
jgi:hypothetical protein